MVPILCIVSTKYHKDYAAMIDSYFAPLWQGTTGSLILARTSAMARDLSQQFQQRTVQKVYLALVRGGAKSFFSTGGQIRSPIQYVNGRASLDPSDLENPSITDWELVGSSVSLPSRGRDL